MTDAPEKRRAISVNLNDLASKVLALVVTAMLGFAGVVGTVFIHKVDDLLVANIQYGERLARIEIEIADLRKWKERVDQQVWREGCNKTRCDSFERQLDRMDRRQEK